MKFSVRHGNLNHLETLSLNGLKASRSVSVETTESSAYVKYTRALSGAASWVIMSHWRLTGVNPHMVLVIGGTGEWPSTAWFRAVVWPFSGVCSDVNFTDIGGGKWPAAVFNWAFKRLLSCKTRNMSNLQFKICRIMKLAQIQQNTVCRYRYSRLQMLVWD